MTSKQKYGLATAIVVLLLIAFLVYYFFLKKTKEKCPDGRDVPANGDCTSLPAQKDSAGNVIPPPAPKPDASGCLAPSTYITNHFPLTLGMQGDFVVELQKGLNAHFNSKLSEDGFLGCHTLEAMQSGFGVTAMDAQLFKDKILTPGTVNQPATATTSGSSYGQVPPIDANGCDANGKDQYGNPCYHV